MENHRLVLPEHLNHHGTLFGGYLLMWVDEMAWLSASLDYPDCLFVTVGMDEVVFKKPVRGGAILHFESSKTRIGNSSITYTVKVTSRDDSIFSTEVTLVRVSETGDKLSLPK